jgi:hypothetical protein
MKKLFLGLILLASCSLGCMEQESRDLTPLETKIQTYNSIYDNKYKWFYDGIYVNNRLEDKYLSSLSNAYNNLPIGTIWDYWIVNQSHITQPEFVKLIRFYAVAKFYSPMHSSIESSEVYVGIANPDYLTKQNDLNLYKIHLMPKEDSLETFWPNLLETVLNDAVLSKKIDILKILPFEDSNLNGAPRIVLYVSGGKENAQNVLDKIYDYYKNAPGNDLIPEFNEKVTDLIYFTQGDRTAKHNYFDKHIRPAFDKAQEEGFCNIIDPKCIEVVKNNLAEPPVVYELPDMIYYSKELGKMKLGKDDLQNDYFHLKNPAKNNQ